MIADFPQLQLRIVAAVERDSRMIQAFQDGEDLHAKTARLVLNEERYNTNPKGARQTAKVINLGLCFGLGPKSFQGYALTEYGVELSLEEAKAYHTRFLSAYPGMHGSIIKPRPTLLTTCARV